MAFSLTGFLKGISLQGAVDRTVQLILQPGGSTGTSTTVTSTQTVNRTITLPDGNGVLSTSNSVETLTNKTIDAGSNTITNLNDATISPTAAIQLSKLAATTPNVVLESNGSGIISPSGVSSTTLTYLDATSSIQTQLNSKQSSGNFITALTGDVVANGPGSVTATIQAGAVTNSKIANSTIDLTAKVTGALPLINGGTGIAAASANAAFNALSPMTTGGDVIYGGAAGVGTRLANGSSGQVLTSSGGTSAPTWATPASGALTTKGDLVTFSTVTTTLPVGFPGQVLTADPTAATGLSWEAPFGVYNNLINGAFDYWQQGISSGSIANGTSVYGADQWYVKNTLGTSGLIVSQRGTGILQGSLYCNSVAITATPTASQANGCELYQVLSNLATQSLIGLTASFSVYILGLGNVTQVGLQFYYATTESHLTTPIGSEVLTTVNNGSYTLCFLNDQALGTAMTASGVVGVRIRMTGVSSGSIFTSGNGFQVEQAMMNVGQSAAPFIRQNYDPAKELLSCQYFYEKSYDLSTSPGVVTTNGQRQVATAVANAFGDVSYVDKRIVPSVTIYSPTTGASGHVRSITNANDEVATAISSGQKNMVFQITVGGGAQCTYHYTVDARIV
jgi:hypothetical protein